MGFTDSAVHITDILAEPVDIILEIVRTYRKFFRLWIWFIAYHMFTVFGKYYYKIEMVPLLDFNSLWVAYIDSFWAYFALSIYPKIFQGYNKKLGPQDKLCITNMSEYSMWTSLFDILHDPTP